MTRVPDALGVPAPARSGRGTTLRVAGLGWVDPERMPGAESPVRTTWG